MLKLPFFEELNHSYNILLAGAGGGHDIYSALPLYFMLQKMKKRILLASYSFTRIERTKADEICDNCSMVTHQTKSPENEFYFPEKWLADWFYEINHDTPIYTFHRVGPSRLLQAYQDLQKILQFDTVILVDGGSDALMKGDELGIGSAAEDISSIITVDKLKIKHTYLCCLGLGIDAYDGVRDSDSLKAVNELQNLNGCKGAILLMKNMTGVNEYIQAVKHANRNSEKNQSLVQNSIISALEGNYGMQKIGGKRFTQIYVHSLMQILWIFDLSIIRNRLLYPTMDNLNSLYEVEREIKDFRTNLKNKKTK
ncbi:MAG: DUF1152 domain-containing protein [Candidatus Thorarchaeota archaeon]